MGKQAKPAWADDADFKCVAVKSVRAEAGGGWSIERADGWSFFVPAQPIEPKPGMVATFFGNGIGYSVRGLLLDGECVFYRTAEEDRIHSEEQRYGKDCAEMLARWDGGEGMWSITLGGFGPGYEQCCQIVMIEALRVLVRDQPDVESWSDPDKWKAQVAKLDRDVMPIVSPLGLSGAQWGAGVSAAAMFYRHGPVEAMNRADRDRHIQVSRDFPTLAKAEGRS